MRSDERRWKLWRIDRGDGAEVWMGVEGPATNPPDDCGLAGTDWTAAATVEVAPVSALLAERKAAMRLLGECLAPVGYEALHVAKRSLEATYSIQPDDDPEPNEATRAWREIRRAMGEWV
jgi:hypothetical protein